MLLKSFNITVWIYAVAVSGAWYEIVWISDLEFSQVDPVPEIACLILLGLEHSSSQHEVVFKKSFDVFPVEVHGQIRVWQSSVIDKLFLLN